MRKFIIFLVIFFVSCSEFIGGDDHYIKTPYHLQSVSGTQTILVLPPEKTLIDFVDFYINNSFVFRDFESPYQYEWDTRIYTNGQYIISVEIYDQLGNILKDEITVYVNNI